MVYALIFTVKMEASIHLTSSSSGYDIIASLVYLITKSVADMYNIYYSNQCVRIMVGTLCNVRVCFVL